jgi:MFS family permease
VEPGHPPRVRRTETPTLKRPLRSERAEGPKRAWLTPGVRGIGSASLLSDLGHEIPTALLPSFLTTPLGAPAAALGVIEGVADGLAGAARLAGGALADDPGRRRTTAVGGYAATAVLSALIGLAGAAWQVGVLRAGAWMARGLRVPARNALLADAVPAAAYGRAYGFERAMDNAGAILGPLLALGLLAAVGVRVAMLVSVIPGLLAAIAIVYAVRHLAPTRQARARQPIRLRVRPVLAGRLGRLLAAMTIFEFGNVAATLFILRATDLLTSTHSHQRAAEIALLLYTAYNVVATVVSLPAGRVADSSSSSSVFTVGIALALGAYLVFAFTAGSIAVLLAAFVLAGGAIGCAETAAAAAVADAAPATLRGSAFGLLAGAQGFGSLAASAGCGAVWTLVSPRAAFIYVAVWMVAALLAITIAGGFTPVRRRTA